MNQDSKNAPSSPNEKKIDKKFKFHANFVHLTLFLCGANVLLLFFSSSSRFIYSLITLGILLTILIFKIEKRFIANLQDLKRHTRKMDALEMENDANKAFMEKLLNAGSELISEQERDALIKKIRDAFGWVTKASAGYLLMYNQNRNLYEWGIGHNLSQLKLRFHNIPPVDALMGKVLSNTSSNILFHELDLLLEEEVLHVKEGILEALVPRPDVLVTIKLQMKSSILGVMFLFLTKTQAEDIQHNIVVFNAFVNMATLALGSAVQREFAINDRMTMMYNHEYFMSRLMEEIAMCRRSSGRTLSLLMIDIDHFKKFNDNYGHQIGDLVLIESAKVYRDNVRITDIVARYGGEEFAIILPQTELKDAVMVAEKIRKAVQDKVYETEQGDLNVTISIGVCQWTPDHDPPLTADLMVKTADLKLYESKEKGRNKVSF
jgi:diguanylate cyclase (GGDEF)-like protein